MTKRITKKQWGFTFVELMIVMLIMAILVTLTVPNYNTFRKNTAAAAAANDFSNRLRLAQSWAIQNEQYVSVNLDMNQQKYVIYNNRTDYSREVQVRKQYNSVAMRLVNANHGAVDGRSTVDISENGSVTITDAGTTVISGGDSYYGLDFMTGGANAVYRVQIFTKGGTKVVRIQ